MLWQLPAWQLVDQSARPFGSRDLAGKVYIANFVFTSCVASCPRLTRQMSHFQPDVQAMHGRARLVSISVDPTNDTPQRLREYAERYGADPSVWTFLTGPADEVMRAVEQGFRIGVQQPARGPHGEFNPIELAHANRFALVDGRGRLRGSYDADDDGTSRLMSDARSLLEER